METTMTGTESPADAVVDAPQTDAAPAESSPAGMPDAATDADAAEPQTQTATQQDTQADPDAAPLTAWAADTVSMPEGVEADAELLAGFGAAAVAAGLSKKQAQALVDWQTKYIQTQAQARLDAGVQALQKAWGARAEANQKAVLGLVSRIDRLMGDDSFSRALGESGATLHPGVVRGLHRIAQLMSEDSIGNAAGAPAEHDETAFEGLENALRESKGRK